MVGGDSNKVIWYFHRSKKSKATGNFQTFYKGFHQNDNWGTWDNMRLGINKNRFEGQLITFRTYKVLYF